MREPGLRLEELEANAENALRIVRYFDSLLEQRLGPEALLTAAAEVAGCRCGVRAFGGQIDFSVDAAGGTGTGEPPPGRAVRSLPSGAETWLARSGPPLPLDQLVLERLSVACAVVLDRVAAQSPRLGDPGLLELMISADADVVDRSRATQLLGFRTTEHLQLVAVAGPAGAVEEVADQLTEQRVRLLTTDLGRIRATATTGTVPVTLRAPRDVRIGVGRRLPAAQAPRSWATAVTALRFATTFDPSSGRPMIANNPVIFSTDLGVYHLLGQHLDTEHLEEIEDLAVLDRMAADESWTDVLTTLHVLCINGTVRATARELHLHHNSVANQLTKAESLLGFKVTEPIGQHRLILALAIRRLRDAAGE